MLHIRLLFLLFLCNHSSVVFGQSFFPLSVVSTSSGIPIAALVAMESKVGQFHVFQIDTGAPQSFVFISPSGNAELNKRLSILSEFSTSPGFLKDSGKRFLIELNSASHRYQESFAAVVSLQTKPSTSGVLGLSWFLDKDIEISFLKSFMKVSKPIRTKLESLPNIINGDGSVVLDDQKRRIAVSVCQSLCELMTVDTGFTVADIVRFKSLDDFVKSVNAEDVVQIPGVLGALKCRTPSKVEGVVKVGGVNVANLLETTCAFSDDPDNIPSRAVFGIRSIIQAKGSIKINVEARTARFSYGDSRNE